MTENHETSLYASLLVDASDDVELLDAWLDERSADLEIGRSELPDAVACARQDNARLSRASGGYDKDIAPGQIRILSKRFTADPDVIPYVAVLEKWHEGMWLVAPFSQYSYPATPGEMTTGIRHLGLRVVQAWNARTMQETLLAKSYLFGELPDSVRKDGLSLFRHEMSGVALPADFHALRGGAIIMECDPRREYLAETIARLQPLSTAVKATERIHAEMERLSQEAGSRFAGKIGKTKFTEAQPRLAAGTRRPCTESYDVGGIALDLEFSPEADEVVMTFYGDDDEKYLGNDGYGVFGANNEFLGVFVNASICVPAESVGESCMLVDPNGEAVSISERT